MLTFSIPFQFFIVLEIDIEESSLHPSKQLAAAMSGDEDGAFSNAQNFVPPSAPAAHSFMSDLRSTVSNWTGFDMATVPTQAPHNFPELFVGGKKKKRLGPITAPTLPKNALATLNKLKPGLKFNLAEQPGPFTTRRSSSTSR